MNNNLDYIRKVLGFAIPLSASSLVNVIVSFASMFMVASLGEDQLAAAALALPTFITFSMVLPIFYAVGILASHYRGQGKEHKEFGDLFKNGLWLAILLAIPTGLILWHADHLLLLFGQDPKLVQLTRLNFHFAAFAIIPMLIGIVFMQFYTGIGHPRFSLILSLITAPLTLFFAYALILGHFGFPKLELGGASCASMIASSLVCIATLIYMKLSKKLKPYHLFSGSFLPNIQLCKTILFLGLPIGLQFFGELGAMTVGTYFMGFFGPTALAASQVVSQYAMLLVMLFLGLSQAMAILTSEAYGKNEISLVRHYLKASMTILLMIFIFIAIFFFFTPRYLIQFFLSQSDINNAYLTHLATVFFAVSVFGLFLDGLRNLYSGTLRGMHDSKVPMKINIMCLWFISLPLCYLIAFPLGGGPIGLRIGFIVGGYVLAAVLLGRRIYKKLKG